MSIPETPRYAECVIPTSKGWLAVKSNGRTELLKCDRRLLEKYKIEIKQVDDIQVNGYMLSEELEDITQETVTNENNENEQSDSLYKEAELSEMGMDELRKIGQLYGVKDRQKNKLIQEILHAQPENE